MPEFDEQKYAEATLEYIMRYPAIKASGKNWLAYFGRSGSGKTTQAAMVCDKILKRREIVTVRFYSFPDLVSEMCALRFRRDEYLQKIQEVGTTELVVFDEFLQETPIENSFEEQVVLALFKLRDRVRKPTIITSERGANEILRLPHGEAIWGRIFRNTNNGMQLTIYGNGAKNWRLPNYERECNVRGIQVFGGRGESYRANCFDENRQTMRAIPAYVHEPRGKNTECGAVHQ